MRVLGGLLSVTAVIGVHHHNQETFATGLVTSKRWREACGKKVHPRHHHHGHHRRHSFLQNPGAGMDPDSIVPFESVLKDGYMLVACVKDSMYVHGDKFGQNKHEYRIGDTANSSIVHYTDHIAKEDREPMTHAVCFEFCRGIPDMGYFGISNGRDCYCETYYKPMASDSTECDSVCEGDNTQMCGGAKKNSIFGMHLCANTEDDLSETLQVGMQVFQGAMAQAYPTRGAARDGQNVAGVFQEAFGQAGDPDMSNLMQEVKAFGGKVEQAADKVVNKGVELKDLVKEIQRMTIRNNDFTDYDTAKEAEDLIKKTTDVAAEVKEMAHEFHEEYKSQVYPVRERFDDGYYDYYYEYYEEVEDSIHQYYPLMYFVDKDFENVPQTCSGDQAASPIFDASLDECASRCDNLPGQCVGIGYFSSRGESICVLWSKFKTVQYYTDCGNEYSPSGDDVPPPKSPSFFPIGKFLQTKDQAKEHRSDQIRCMAKLSKFEGLNLKPQDDGKCDVCLKEATKAKRCY